VVDAVIGTTSGVLRLRDGGLEPLGLDGHRVTALHASRDVVLAGTYGDGLFLSGDGGRSWEELDGVTRIPGHERWYLPYSPRAGAARNAYVSGDRLLVAAEVAGLLRSEDGGRTWVCEPVAGDEDVHHVTAHPDDPDLLYVSLGSASLNQREGRHGGIARSRDGGQTWEKLETDYTRATIVPPQRPDLLLAGPALRVGRGGRIVVSSDGGDTWEPAGHGIEMPMPDMVELFVAAPDGAIWAICSAGRLLRAAPGEWSWSSALPADTEISVQSIAFP
jgi:photosystem II stability/assembly factor-like uncharacterized protein